MSTKKNQVTKRRSSRTRKRSLQAVARRTEQPETVNGERWLVVVEGAPWTGERWFTTYKFAEAEFQSVRRAYSDKVVRLVAVVEQRREVICYVP